ncbi:MAG: AAA family ATPase [Lentisphaerae bacterium]|jgi:hypothetical protein|nr:AAA family ATPase [Lentisphaerota bacterium]MBT5605616.1 AAA family ATPase [Lentisphaerota bacterium]MBT7053798.1 AAA family ATPase [Lentisphaerota bacterium]MBT7847177.1 AAA family ATPase [Lentisphaerota bacterium]
MIERQTIHYAVRRVRLINFHNFVHETIDLENAGHLFLLGDNASGKTTILDAVHYALTAGQEMEFNSAARVAGSRTDGRRLQGVIMRYNVDTGPMNEGDTITYVAVEILGRHGKPTTVGVGMTARAMGERLNRWGFIRECPLEDIPLLVEEAGQQRPAGQQELRDWFNRGTGFFNTMASYRRELAQRFFGGEDTYTGVCHLLSMGKAYREIVSHTTDYHELFKALLPEPRTELFERLIEALKGLDASTAELQHLEDRGVYLNELLRTVDAITDLRQQGEDLLWVCRFIELQSLQGQIEGAKNQSDARQRKLAGFTVDLDKCRVAQQHQEKRIADFKSTDSSGLITKEKDLVSELEENSRTADDARGRLKNADKVCRQHQKSLDAGRKVLREATQRFLVDVTRHGAALPFPVTELLAGLEQVVRHELPETAVSHVPVAAFRKYISAAGREPEQQQAVLRHRLSLLDLDRTTLVHRLEALSASDLVGSVDADFRRAVAMLRERMLRVQPLYEGLEWAAGLSSTAKAAVEESVGLDVLMTLLVEPEDYDSVREVVVGQFPRLRVTAGNEETELPEWIRTNFDITRSEPRALRALALEMETRRGPKVNREEGSAVLLFRAHERRLSGAPAELIGADTREDALERRRKALQKQLHDLDTTIKQLRGQEHDQAALLERLTVFQGLLEERAEAMAGSAEMLRELGQSQAAAQAEFHRWNERVTELNEKIGRLDERLKEVRAMIAKQGLDKLDAKMRKARKKLEGLRSEEAELHKQMGVLENQIRGLGEQLEKRLGPACAQAQVALEQQTALVQGRYPEGTDLAVVLLPDGEAAGLPEGDALRDQLGELGRREAELQGELRERLKHPEYSPVYAFTYEAQANRLMDRRSRTVQELTRLQERAIAEQKEVINEKTYQLFRKIIMEGLLKYLKQQVLALDEMLKQINRLLADRQFGRSEYRFQLKEVDKYRRLLEIVRNFNPFDDEGEDELRNFFEDHRDEIFETEVNQVPEVLDYRNWYHYDMRVHTLDKAGVLMDRRTKSVGSGGEQAVPNYLLILTVAHFLFAGSNVRLRLLLFDEAFYGIDAGRRDQILGFATDLGLQLFVASPDQDGVKQEVAYSTTLLVVKDEEYDVHLYPYHWANPEAEKQMELLPDFKHKPGPVEFGDEI